MGFNHFCGKTSGLTLFGGITCYCYERLCERMFPFSETINDQENPLGPVVLTSLVLYEIDRILPDQLSTAFLPALGERSNFLSRIQYPVPNASSSFGGVTLKKQSILRVHSDVSVSLNLHFLMANDIEHVLCTYLSLLYPL